MNGRTSAGERPVHLARAHLRARVHQLEVLVPASLPTLDPLKVFLTLLSILHWKCSYPVESVFRPHVVFFEQTLLNTNRTNSSIVAVPGSPPGESAHKEVFHNFQLFKNR